MFILSQFLYLEALNRTKTSPLVSRIRIHNVIKLNITLQIINVLLNSNLISIEEKLVNIEVTGSKHNLQLENDLVYIFAGGELPTQFLKNCGITITRKFGEAVLEHVKK